MNLSDSSTQANQFVDEAARAASRSLDHSQHLAHEAVNGASQAMSHLGERADALSQRGAEALRRSSEQIRKSAQQAGDSTLNYIREEPLKAVLIAAATGAALAMLARLMAGSRR